MRAGWVGNDALQDRARARDGGCGFIVEVIREVAADIVDTPDEWDDADATLGFDILDTGGVRLDPGTENTVVHSTGTDTATVTKLRRTRPFNALKFEWANASDEHSEIRSFVARLHPQANGGNPKTVATWRLDVWRVTQDGSGSDDTPTLVENIARVDVTAAGTSASDVTFDIPTESGRYPTAGPAPALANRPQTIFQVTALQSDGSEADNVAWVSEASTSGADETTHVVSSVDVTDHLNPDGTEQVNGTAWDLESVNAYPRYTLNLPTYSAGTITFSSGNLLDLGAAPTESVEFTVRAEEPGDSSVGVEVNDGVGSGWLTVVDGDVAGQDNTAEGGSDLSTLAVQQTYQHRTTLTPTTDGHSTPTIFVMGVRDLVSTNLIGAASVSGLNWAVDPVTRKGEITAGTFTLPKTGERDHRDYGSLLLSENHVGSLLLRLWWGASGLARRYWLHVDSFEIDDYHSTDDAHVIRATSPLARLRGETIPPFVETSGGNGTRAPVAYENQTLKAVYDDLVDTQVALPGRFRGPGVADATTTVTHTIEEEDAKDTLDVIADLDGSGIITSQGRLKVVPIIKGVGSPVASFPLGSHEAKLVGPGFGQRTDEVFTKWNWDPVTERFLDEDRQFNAAALGNLGKSGLHTTQQTDERVSRWIDTLAHAQSYGQRQVTHFGTGMILWVIAPQFPVPHLEPGDPVTVEVDQFVARSPVTGREIRGRVSAAGVVQQVAPTDGDGLEWELRVWIPSFDDILASQGTTTRSGYAEPIILGGSGGITLTTGDVDLAVMTKGAGSVRVATSTADYPTLATTQAAGATATDSSGLAELTASAGLAVGETLYVSALAYEDASGGGNESGVLHQFRVTRTDASKRFVSSLTFSASDSDTVAWTSGSIVVVVDESNTTTYSITAGNTGNMAALTYIYLDPSVSTTVLQTSTTASDAAGENIVLVGIAEPSGSTSDAAFYPSIGAPGLNEAHLSVVSLSALVADMGTLTAGKIDVGSIEINADTERILFGSASAPLTGVGIFVGKDGTDYEFRVGDPSGDMIHWDGSALSVGGTITASSFTASAVTFDGSLTMELGGNFSWLVVDSDSNTGPRIDFRRFPTLNNRYALQALDAFEFQALDTSEGGAQWEFQDVPVLIEQGLTLGTVAFTQRMEITDAGSAGATEAAWVELELNGTTTYYMRLHTTK